MMLFRFTAQTVGHDQYDGLIVAANSEQAARKVVSERLNSLRATRGKQTVDDFKVERVLVRELKTGIVMTDFNAG